MRTKRERMDEEVKRCDDELMNLEEQRKEILAENQIKLDYIEDKIEQLKVKKEAFEKLK